MTDHPKLILALPKGRILDEVSPMLAACGIVPEAAFTDEKSRLLQFKTNLPHLDIIRVRSFDVATFTAFGAAHPAVDLVLFDLPAVVPAAGARFAAAGLSARTRILPGSFRDDPLPQGADTITLVRVLYDHADATVGALLRAAYVALPPGGRSVVSEPMSGGDHPDRATDVYFSIYTLAMQTGRTRSGAEIARLLADAGFSDCQIIPGFRPFVTSVVSATRPRDESAQKSV